MPLDSAPDHKTILQRPESVRVATPADEQRLFDLLWVELDRDNSMGFGKSAAKVMANVQACCRGTHGIAGVIEAPDGTLIGSVGIAASQFWYSDAWFLSETWLFLRPEYRRGATYGRDLFNFALWHREDMSRRLGHEFALEISVYSFNRLEAKTRLWRRYARHAGSLFMINGEPYYGQ